MRIEFGSRFITDLLTSGEAGCGSTNQIQSKKMKPSTIAVTLCAFLTIIAVNILSKNMTLAGSVGFAVQFALFSIVTPLEKIAEALQKK